MNGNTKWLQWILGILVVIAISVSGYAVQKADRAVLKEDYRADMHRIYSDLCIINAKLDRLIEKRER